MDFELDEELQLFQNETHAWVDRECPKAWARELEQHEHEWPFELFDKFTAAGFHGIGIPEEYGGQGGNVVVQMILARELARTLGGLAWLWGITSFAGAKSIGTYGTEEQKQRFLPGITRGRVPLRDRLHRARRRNGRPRWHAHVRHQGRRRLGAERQ